MKQEPYVKPESNKSFLFLDSVKFFSEFNFFFSESIFPVLLYVFPVLSSVPPDEPVCGNKRSFS